MWIESTPWSTPCRAPLALSWHIKRYLDHPWSAKSSITFHCKRGQPLRPSICQAYLPRIYLFQRNWLFEITIIHVDHIDTVASFRDLEVRRAGDQKLHFHKQRTPTPGCFPTERDSFLIRDSSMKPRGYHTGCDRNSCHYGEVPYQQNMLSCSCLAGAAESQTKECVLSIAMLNIQKMDTRSANGRIQWE